MERSDPTKIETAAIVVPDRASACSFSILIGRVSTEDNTRILETLNALRAQDGSPDYEVILADRRGDSVTEHIKSNYPEVQLLSCAADTSLPALRTRAFDKACGHYIVVTEDHCVPPKGWLAAIMSAFQSAPANMVAVGGPIENGVVDTAFDWATFICEYSAFASPVQTGPSDTLPGMNVTYRRAAIAELDKSLLTSGFWETTVHPVLRERGLVFYLSNDVGILHKKKFSFRLFTTQRFLYSRYYAGLRFRRDQVAPRVVACGLTLALPPLLLLRMVLNHLGKPRIRSELIRALPYLAVFSLVWAWGEMVGYISGVGDALSRIE